MTSAYLTAIPLSEIVVSSFSYTTFNNSFVLRRMCASHMRCGGRSDHRCEELAGVIVYVEETGR